MKIQWLGFTRQLSRLILSCVCLAVVAQPQYSFDTAKQEAQFKALLHDLRCPVCQNQDLADSNAGVAVDLRQEIYQRVRANQSDEQITRYLTDRYGDFILLKPPLMLTTLVLWLGPIGLLLLGLLSLVRVYRQDNRS